MEPYIFYQKYKDIANFVVYRKMGLEYADICHPSWIDSDIDLFWGKIDIFAQYQTRKMFLSHIKKFFGGNCFVFISVDMRICLHETRSIGPVNNPKFFYKILTSSFYLQPFWTFVFVFSFRFFSLDGVT